MFTGRLITVRPNKPTYDTDEEVTLSIVGEVTYAGGGGDWTGNWRTYYSVYDDTGKKIAGSNHNHSIAPWTKEDYAKDSFTLKCGKARAGKLRVRLVAMPSLFSSSYSFIDDQLVDIHVAGQAAPGYYPVEPGWDPTAPSPTPWPPVTIPDTEPAIPPSTGPTIGGVELPSWFLPVIIGGIALVVLLPKGKSREGK